MGTCFWALLHSDLKEARPHTLMGAIELIGVSHVASLQATRTCSSHNLVAFCLQQLMLNRGADACDFLKI